MSLERAREAPQNRLFDCGKQARSEREINNYFFGPWMLNGGLVISVHPQ